MAFISIDSTNTEEIYEQAATKITSQIAEICSREGKCSIGLVGGRMQEHLLSALTAKLKGISGRIDVYWLDERISGEKNYLPAIRHMERMRGNLIHIFWHPLKTTSKESIISEGERVLSKLTKERGTLVFDIVILSAGEDGHIASVFPRSPLIVKTEKKYFFVDNSPKPPTERVSVSAGFLLTASHGHLFFMGAGKQKAYGQYLDPSVHLRECPAKLLNKLPDLTVYSCAD
jgi:6-phosphogluconolactonase